MFPVWWLWGKSWYKVCLCFCIRYRVGHKYGDYDDSAFNAKDGDEFDDDDAFLDDDFDAFNDDDFDDDEYLQC